MTYKQKLHKEVYKQNMLPMKKLCIIPLLLLLFSLSFAQKRAIKKTEKLFRTKKYSACIEYASKQVHKHPKMANLHYYISYAQLKSRRKKYDYKTSFYHFLEAKKLDVNQQLNIQFGDKALYTAHRRKVKSICSRKSIKEARYYIDVFAQEFQDTLVCFEFIEKKRIVDEKKKPNFQLKLRLDSLIDYAKTHQGKPYKYGKEGPNAFDCSGFVLYVHQNFGINLPHNAHMISELETGKEVSINNIQKGDLVFFGTTRAYHVGMYISEPNESPKIIHCVSRGVMIDEFNDTKHWKPSKVYKVKRYHDLHKKIQNNEAMNN